MSDKVKVLIVEDDASMLKILGQVLTDEGFDVVAVARAEDAVAEAARQPFDLIVTDIRMGEMDGLDALEQAKQHQPNVGSLVVSGYASEAETLRAVRLNVGGYLKKPFRMRDFVAHVRDILGKRQKELEQSGQSTKLKRALLCSLESLSRFADEAAVLGPSGALFRAGILAKRLAEETRLSPEVSEQLRLGAMVAGILPADNAKPLEELRNLKPLPMLARMVEHSLKPDSSPTSETQLIALALEASRHWGSEGELPKPGELTQSYDAKLLEAYTRVAKEELPGPAAIGPTELLLGVSDPQRTARSLLTLGRVLEQSGDRKGASRAYEQITSGESISRESVEAHLGLARLALPAPEARSLAVEAIRSSTALGPIAHAEILLEGAMVLYRTGGPETAEALERSCEAFRQLGLTASECRARLALACLKPNEAGEHAQQALSYLFEPGQAVELSRAVLGLLPDLIGLAVEPGHLTVDQIRRLCLDFPEEMGRILAHQTLEVEHRVFLIDTLETAEVVPDSILKALLQDPDPTVKQAATKLSGRLTGQATPPLIRIHSLGFLEVHRGQRAVPDSAWSAIKIKYLLGYLAWSGDRPVVEDRVIEDFWPSATRKSGKNSIYNATSAVRRALRRDDGQPDPPVIIRERESLRLNPDIPRWHDVEEMQRYASQASAAWESGEKERGARLYRRVAQLYRGPYLDGCYMDWALARRQSLESQALTALARLTEYCLDTSKFSQAVEYATRVLDVDCHRQDMYLALMQAHIGLGQPESAIRQFERCKKLLARDFETEPSIELLKAYHQAQLGVGGPTIG